MIAYLDSSVVLRLVLGQMGALREWRSIETGVASALVEVECLRALDRERLRGTVPGDELVRRREAVYDFLSGVERVEPSPPVLARAAQPLPVVLGTLDAIHLVTAMLWAETRQAEVVLATHDRVLGRAARASGLRVIGV